MAINVLTSIKVYSYTTLLVVSAIAFLENSPTFMYKYLESMQLLSHLCYINQNIPYQFDQTLQQLLLFHPANLIPRPFEFYFNHEEEDFSSKQIPSEYRGNPKLYILGNKTPYFHINSSLVITVTIIHWTIYLIYVFFRKIRNKRQP